MRRSRNPQRRRIALALALVGLLLIPGVAAGSPNRRAWIPAACGQPPLRQHPSTFAFSCDANVVFTGVRWQHWGTATATGIGVLNLVDGCIPDCASAPRYQYAARIVATSVALCGSRRVYSMLTAYLSERDVRGQKVLHAPRLLSCVR